MKDKDHKPYLCTGTLDQFFLYVTLMSNVWGAILLSTMCVTQRERERETETETPLDERKGITIINYHATLLPKETLGYPLWTKSWGNVSKVLLYMDAS